MPTTKSAIDAKELAALIQDANASHQISPLRFTDQLMYDLRDLEARATVELRTAELQPPACACTNSLIDWAEHEHPRASLYFPVSLCLRQPLSERIRK